MAVPDTYTYSLSNVRTELQFTGNTNKCLSGVIGYAPLASYDNAYEGTRSCLRNFRKYSLITTYPCATLTTPRGVMYDGKNVWVANHLGGNIIKVTSGGTMTGYALGVCPYGLAFDGTNIWSANWANHSVSKITTGGTLTATYDLGLGVNPVNIAFDGTNMWTANHYDNSVSKITPGGTATRYSLGASTLPMGIAFDGTNMWTANGDANKVSKITPGGTVTTSTATTGTCPIQIIFDGTYMWTANYCCTVTKVTLSDCSMTTYVVGNTFMYPNYMAFDGTYIWLSNQQDWSVTRVCPNGAVKSRYCTCFAVNSSGPVGIAFASNTGFMWASNTAINSNVQKIGAI